MKLHFSHYLYLLLVTLAIAAFGLVERASASSEAFTAKDFIISSDAGDAVGKCDLGATLLFPIDRQPKALILFVHGSGTTNRDGLVLNMRPFKDMAEYLSSNGYATLRFDKRGINPACIPAIIDNIDLSPMHFIQDVRNVIAFGKALPETIGIPIVLAGHSEGVNFVAELAIDQEFEVKGLVLLAGLGRYPIDVTLLRQYQQLVDSPSTLPESRFTALEQIRLGKIFFTNLRLGLALPTDQYMGVYSKYWNDWISITDRASDVAAKVKVPSLVLRGTADSNVTLEDFKALSTATSHINGSRNQEFEGLHHFFMKPKVFNVDSTVLKTISTWLDSLLFL